MKTTSNLKPYYNQIINKLKAEEIDFNDKEKVFKCFDSVCAPKFCKLVWLEMNGLVSIIR